MSSRLYDKIRHHLLCYDGVALIELMSSTVVMCKDGCFIYLIKPYFSIYIVCLFVGRSVGRSVGLSIYLYFLSSVYLLPSFLSYLFYFLETPLFVLLTSPHTLTLLHSYFSILLSYRRMLWFWRE